MLHHFYWIDHCSFTILMLTSAKSFVFCRTVTNELRWKFVLRLFPILLLDFKFGEQSGEIQIFYSFPIHNLGKQLSHSKVKDSETPRAFDTLSIIMNSCLLKKNWKKKSRFINIKRKTKRSTSYIDDDHYVPVPATIRLINIIWKYRKLFYGYSVFWTHLGKPFY